MSLEKGFIDERDNYRYVFKESSFVLDELSNFCCILTFNYYNATTLEKINEYVLIRHGEFAQFLYTNWSDLKIAYEQLVLELGIQIELPESMDYELFE